MFTSNSTKLNSVPIIAYNSNVHFVRNVPFSQTRSHIIESLLSPSLSHSLPPSLPPSLRGATVPDPPEGHTWKIVQHDCKVTWLASWSENIQGQTKYVMLNPTSRLKVCEGEGVFECACVWRGNKMGGRDGAFVH